MTFIYCIKLDIWYNNFEKSATFRKIEGGCQWLKI